MFHVTAGMNSGDSSFFVSNKWPISDDSTLIQMDQFSFNEAIFGWVLVLGAQKGGEYKDKKGLVFVFKLRGFFLNIYLRVIRQIVCRI